MIYEYICPDHGKFATWSPLAQRHDPKPCKSCGKESTYTISAPRVFGDFEAYESPASGRWIEGRRQRQEDFARTGTRPYEEGEYKHAARMAAENEQKADAEVETAVERTIGELRSN